MTPNADNTEAKLKPSLEAKSPYHRGNAGKALLPLVAWMPGFNSFPVSAPCHPTEDTHYTISQLDLLTRHLLQLQMPRYPSTKRDRVTSSVWHLPYVYG